MMTQDRFTEMRELRREVATVLRKVDHFLRDNGDEVPRGMPSIETIQRVTARFYRFKVHELKSVRRSADLVFARHMAMYLSKELTDRSYPAIARAFRHRHHTTVIHAVRKIDRANLTDAKVAKDIAALVKQIGAAA